MGANYPKNLFCPQKNERHEQKQAVALRTYSPIGRSPKDRHAVDYFRAFRVFRGQLLFQGLSAVAPSPLAVFGHGIPLCRADSTDFFLCNELHCTLLHSILLTVAALLHVPFAENPP
ncbi:MAG TPA: hypothetical protein VJ001_17250 [Rhodocyclaceae bacterium]|nr:hypothetical protein [Rhodocyclaceae bacterium]